MLHTGLPACYSWYQHMLRQLHKQELVQRSSMLAGDLGIRTNCVALQTWQHKLSHGLLLCCYDDTCCIAILPQVTPAHYNAVV